MSNRSAVWPLYSRTRVPLLESIKRTTPSRPAEKSRCVCLGCHTSFTIPADWSYDCLSIWVGMSQQLIFPLSVPVTTRFTDVSGQNETASTELWSSEPPTPTQDKVHRSCKRQIFIKDLIIYEKMALINTLPVWLLYSLAVESKDPETIKLLSRWQSIEETPLVWVCPPFECWRTASVFKSNTFTEPST